MEVSAGGIVFRRTPQGVRIGLIRDPFGKWAFAKGHVEKGETIEQAAARETREEMGLEGLRIIAPLGQIDFWFRDRYREESRGTLIHKYVHYFLMEAPSASRGRPQRQERIHRIIWIDPRRLPRTSSYKDVAPVIAKVMKYFGVHRPPRSGQVVKGSSGQEKS